MRRVKIAVFLLLTILVVCVAGYLSVDRVSGRIGALLETAKHQNQGGDTPALKETLSQLQDYYADREWLLSLFVRHDYAFSALPSLGALESYAAQSDQTELDAELERASAQILTMRHLFLRFF